MKTRWTSGIAGQWLLGLKWFSLYRDRHTVPLGLLNRIIICTLSHTTPVHSCLKTHADTDSFICLKLHTHTPTLQLTHLSEASHTQTKFICVNLHTHLYSLTCLQLHKHLSSLICLKFQDSSVVRVLDLWSKGRGFKSLQEWRENFFSGVKFLCWLLFWYLFHPHVTAVARKRPWSVCQKLRWQVTAKYTRTLCI